MSEHLEDQDSFPLNLAQSVRNAVSNFSSSSGTISGDHEDSNLNEAIDCTTNRINRVHRRVPIIMQSDYSSSDESSSTNDMSGDEDRFMFLWNITRREIENRRIFSNRSKELSDLKPWSNIEMFLLKQDMEGTKRHGN